MKRTSNILFALLLLLAAGVASCGNPSHRAALQRAEALLETDPHAARTVLDSLILNSDIDCQTSDYQTSDECLGKGLKAKVLSDSLKSVSLKSFSRRDAALYAILRTQADYKCFVPLTSDSLVRIATDYYGTPRRKHYHAAMAWYSLGCVASEQKDDLKAIEAYLRAMELFPDTTVRYYSLAEQNLGIHYLNRQMLDDALTTFHSCSARLQATGSWKDLAYINYHTALAHLYNKEYAEARQGFNDTWESTYSSRFLKGESLLQLAKLALHDSHDYAVALDYVDRHIAFTDARYLGVDYSLKGDAYNALGMPDSAYHYYRQSLHYDNEIHTLCCDYKELAELAPLTGRTDSLAFYVQQYTLLLDSIGELRRSEEIVSLQNNHAMELERRQMNDQQRRTWLLSAFVLLLVLLLFILWFLQHDRQRKSDYITLVDKLRQSQLKKYGNLQDTLDSCCELFRKTAAYEIMTEAAQASSPHIDKKAPTVISHDINACFLTFRTAVKSEAPKLNEREFAFLVCHYLGFDLHSIALFLSSAYSTITAMKSRLKNKMPANLFNLFFPAS
ncbi:MAG: hypothetical protein IKP91_06140 [Bacteroidaceae bacterium]|nr:hypothetical protein [Bacteroidaceae bacterium]